MEDRSLDIPYIAFEGEMTRMERVNHRLWILCICMLVILIGTNAGWIWYESQFEYITESTNTEITQSAKADNSSAIRIIGGDYYGDSESDDPGN